ncbi:tyrosine-type recombinase/integrase [Alicyclobacillus fastidiosus]|uniref:Tyrosine-type recombinase/integrase n=1 Tax=Alicyclobacillus fastidiosus TaxID=392011 RepID=A0ABY6ZLX4_9BACL|nr:tyrosine-type recombinase/integrase [Alicyclobacillus fastidiosus]WAH42965.1 tyrosine-type recombinase/integrase [Alicyclobacillus fastidiosus]GMA64929.1 integrase [Alicyclobacillus fastidiosus]
MKLSIASETFLSVRNQEGFSRQTIRAYRLQHKLLIRDVGDMEIADVTLQTLRDHLNNNGHLKPASLGHKIRAIKSLFNWLTEEELVSRNPTLKLKEPKRGKRVPKALTIEELEMLRDSCLNPLEHALVEFSFATGCRVAELQRVNCVDIDWQRSAVNVLGKGNKEREVYFGAKACIWLQRYIEQRSDSDRALFVTVRKPHRMSIHQIQYVFKRIVRRCGLEERVSSHKMRHTLATVLINQGAPLVAVQSILGHEKPETTQLYAALSGSTRQQSYQRYFVQ